MKKIERLEIMIERYKKQPKTAKNSQKQPKTAKNSQKQPKTKTNCELIGKLRAELQKEINKQ